MSNYITLINNNGSGAVIIGDGDGGMVGIAHDADG